MPNRYLSSVDRYRRYWKGSMDHYKLSPAWTALLVSLFIVLFLNLPFWREIFSINGRTASPSILFPLSIFILLVCFFSLILSLIGIKYLFKPLLVVILNCAAVVSYFMNSYGVVIDRSMIVNIFETDMNEVTDLLSTGLFLNLLFLGVIPSLLICFLKIDYRNFTKELGRRVSAIFILLVSMTLIAGLQYKDIAFIYRNNRHIRYLVNPSYPFYALYRYFHHNTKNSDVSLIRVGDDARRNYSRRSDGKKFIVILVVGETARAENFVINNYSRGTNPRLKKKDIINFSNVYACGTATAESIPCMFSHLGSSEGGRADSKRHENLLDVLSHAGIDVLWRDNNSGCKGVCNRVKTESLTSMHTPGVCSDGQCYDEILLENLRKYINKSNNDMLIVLHQNGSHGPAYYKRSPSDFKIFTPECRNNQVQDCARQDIINSYDNTILYTDYFLSKVIEYLDDISTDYDTAMLYLSDHGESLGENGIYLHGLPYLIAPDGQKHIPMVFWSSQGYTAALNIDRSCVSASSNKKISHDNLFDTMLGLFQVETSVYRIDRDIFAPCEGLNNI